MDAEEPGVDPDRAFWLLSDGTRLDILRAVWAADADLAVVEADVSGD